MVSAAKAFSAEPPKEPLTNLFAIVEDFKWRYVDREKTDQVVAYCASSPTFRLAVARAVESRDRRGKHHNHQSKVDITARRLFGRRIVSRRSKVSRIVMDKKADRFDQLHDLFDEIKPFGIGPVTVYDVAVRVGAYLRVQPTSVYMHAGVKQGMKAFQDAMFPGEEYWHRMDRVPVSWLPPPFSDMRADDVEDILCTYREVFEAWRAQG